MARAQQNDNRVKRTEGAQALVLHEPRMPVPADTHLKQLGITASQWKTIVEAIWPSAKTVDGVMMALDYCKARSLDPFKRPVHIVPMWNSALGCEVETVWPGINDYRTTASRTGVFAGNDDCLFGPKKKKPFKDQAERGRGQNKMVVRAECGEVEFFEWAQMTVYKMVQGQRVPFVGPKVYWLEIFSGQKGLRVPNERWQQSPNGMLEKCAEAAALRRAFPEEFAGTYTAEEMEGKVFHGGPNLGAKPVHHDEAIEGEVVDERPTRESVAEEPWTEKGIPKELWDEIEHTQKNIDLTNKVKPLCDAKESLVDKAVADGWPEPAIDELEARFDARIRALEPPKNEELPLDGDAAGASADQSGEPANEEEEEQ